MTGPAIFVLGPSALPLALDLKRALGGDIHAPAGGDVAYARATDHLAVLFRHGRPIVALCASGIVIRALAPELRDKTTEPAVVAVAEDGSSAVPLLGGHHGANDLARRIAALTGGQAAITTASEVRFGTAFDEPGPAHVLANPHDMKAAVAAGLRGEAVVATVTERAQAGSAAELVYHPRTLVIGAGAERGAAAEALIALAQRALAAAGLAPQSVACVASLDLKADEDAIHRLAAHFGVPARFFTAEDLRREAHRVRNPSVIVEREVGVPAVAEAAALAAAGPDAELVVEKTKAPGVTLAIVRAARPLLALPGRARGTLHVVGIGPGTPDWRSPAAQQALETATDWVGYGLYLDLVADLRTSQHEHRFPLGGEEERVRHAIALAAEGHEVALVCSGDAGIYAMASLVFEVIDREPRRIAVNVIPGISAFQAAAARAGALIGHDFCCISLSDLLTPWAAIERRVIAAAEGDFVVAFYNPRSQKRVGQLTRAMGILAEHRPADTPVVIASNLGRPDERLGIVALQDFAAESVDMLTLVLVGSSQSRTFTRGDGSTVAYTPRGYARKREAVP
jgi:cobalt-precorrin 5A hydrolase/precorrin-3B C17-methyltransferase